jgi:hypothetical protein
MKPAYVPDLFRVSREEADAIRHPYRHYYKYLKGFCSLRKPTSAATDFIVAKGEIQDACTCLMRMPRYAQTAHIRKPYATIFNEDVFFRLIKSDQLAGGAIRADSTPTPSDEDCDNFYLATMMLVDFVMGSGEGDGWDFHPQQTTDPKWDPRNTNFAIAITAVKRKLDWFVFTNNQLKRKQKTPQKA